MEQLCQLEVFGIQIKCRPDWRVVPDASYSLNYDSGLFRFEENVVEKKSRVSLGLRWECSMSEQETFLNEFRANIQTEYQKAIKGKGRQFQLLRDEIIERPDGSQLCVVETKYRATQSLVPDPKKMQRLHVCNAALYCEASHRMIICSVVTTPEYMEEHRDSLMDMMTSVQSRSLYSPEEEAARMEKRSQLREAAARKNQSPLTQLKQYFENKKSCEVKEKST